MKLLLVLFLFVVTTYGHPNAIAETQRSLIRRKRLVKGTDADIKSYPYVVQIEHKTDGFRCGGSIISKYYVLSAAHCVDSYSYDEIRIRAGSTERGVNGSTHDIEKWVQHESYKLNSFMNSVHDIAVITVKTAFEYGETRKPISLWTEVISEEQERKDQFATLGWGAFSDNHYLFSNKLQVIELPYVSKKLCKELYQKYGGIYEGQICIGTQKANEKDICYGDSGGPVVLNKTLIAITAYGEGECGKFNYPSVFTEVAYYVDWIKKNAKFDD